jgi:hypothetical protein
MFSKQLLDYFVEGLIPFGIVYFAKVILEHVILRDERSRKRLAEMCFFFNFYTKTKCISNWRIISETDYGSDVNLYNEFLC